MNPVGAEVLGFPLVGVELPSKALGALQRPHWHWIPGVQRGERMKEGSRGTKGKKEDKDTDVEP